MHHVYGMPERDDSIGRHTAWFAKLLRRERVKPYISLVLACGLLAGAAALALLFLTGPRYTSTATILLSPRLSVDLNADVDGSRTLDTEARLLNSGAVLEPAARSVGSSVAELRNDVEVSPVTNTRLIRISAEGPSPEVAQKTVAAVFAAYRAYRVESQNREVSEYGTFIADRLARIDEARSAPGSPPPGSVNAAALEDERTRLLTDLEVVRSVGRSATGGVSVSDPPSLPEESSYFTAAARSLALAVALGLAIGVAVAIQQVLTRDVVISPKDIEENGGLPVLADFRAPAQGHTIGQPSVELIAQTTSAAEVSAIRREIITHAVQRLAVAGLADSETTTYAAIRLATGVASTGTAVLVVLTDPSAGTLFEDMHSDGPGLAAVAAGRAGLEDVLWSGQRLGVPDLSVVPAGAGADPVTLLSSKKTRMALEQAAEHWQLVVVVCSAVDAPLVAAFVDGCVLAVPARRTSRKELERAARAIAEHRTPILGAVLTHLDDGRPRHRWATTARRRISPVPAARVQTGA
jgi:capsular polysaccharide biosynthesis protein/Mrp family chromosome partitioning ATPase